jgi:hypothetical protein
MFTDHRSRALCALAAAGALVAFPGCGSSSKKSTSTSAATTTAPATTGGGDVASYKAGAQKAASAFKTSAAAASAQVKGATDTAGKVKGLESLKASVNTAADDFSKLNPPANAKAENDQLVQEFRSLANNVDSVEQALKTNDKNKAASALPRLAQDEANIAKTLAALQAKIGA